MNNLIFQALVAALVTCWQGEDTDTLITTGNVESILGAASRLDEASIPYRINAAGTGIEVPTAHRDEALVVAASGLESWQDILDHIDR